MIHQGRKQKKQTKMKNAYLVLDVETSGPICGKAKHGILAVGFCLGTDQGELIENGKICFMLSESQFFDEHTLKNFWMRDGPYRALLQIQKKAKPLKVALNELVKKFDMWDSQYHVTIVSDNPVFDLGFINSYFAMFLNRKPVCYKYGKHYAHQRVIDLRSFATGKMNKDYREIRDKRFQGICYNHLPDNDAHYLYLLWNFVKKYDGSQ